MNHHSDRRVSAERTINAPAAAIFAVLADPTQHPLIDGAGALTTTTPTPDRARQLTLGSTFVTAMNRRPNHLDSAHLLQITIAVLNRGRITNTVVEFEPNRRIAWRNFGRHIWRYELKPIDNHRTTVRETFDYSTNLAPWLLELVNSPTKNAHAIATTLQRLDHRLTTPARANPSNQTPECPVGDGHPTGREHQRGDRRQEPRRYRLRS